MYFRGNCKANELVLFVGLMIVVHVLFIGEPKMILFYLKNRV